MLALATDISMVVHTRAQHALLAAAADGILGTGELLSLPPPGAAAADECTVYRYHSRGEDDYFWGCACRLISPPSTAAMLSACGVAGCLAVMGGLRNREWEFE